MFKSILSIVLASSTVGFTSVYAESNVETATNEMKSMFYDVINKDTSAVEFEKGKSTLSENERQNLASLVKAVKSDSRVKKVVVAAWADKEYPATAKTDLPKADRDLADARLKTLKDVLDNLGLSNVETHTMAEHPSWLAKTFNTEDSKLKGEGKIEDQEDRRVAEIGKILQSKGGPGKAVVVVQRAVDFPQN